MAAKTAKKAAKKSGAKKAPAKSASSAKPMKKNASAKNENDIVTLILEDHKPLKKLIKVLKDSENDIDERRAAFEEFAPLLVTHAKPEEESLYVFMKKDEELREEAFEGDVEHGLADQMLEEIKRTDDEDLWSARVKVLAELVEHHIEEEEEELLPDFRKNSDVEERMQLGQQFLQLKDQYMSRGGDDAPHEADIDEEETHARH